MRKRTALYMMLGLLILTWGCGGKNEEAKEPAGEEQSIASVPESVAPEGRPEIPAEGLEMPQMGQGMPPGMGQQKPAQPKQIVVSDTIKTKWPASRIKVINRNGDAEGMVFEVAPGDSFEIEGSTLRVEVGQYLPDFSMDPQFITSKSEDPNNPTVKLVIYDGNEEIFSGWAFEQFPDAHAFVHPDYSITLVGGVRGK